ncbi:DUF1127 domain-containing protein [uncultured Tateyamaria sp.]|uniref:DUF1127 domain-containing protein n=1 Tax=uncultured Tateyamaria sp. TaxID=455651 RepID=UPI0026210D03|nr:DUF1127 domain-containing protein [uncultured Tateyamaria sp.]
MALIDTTARHTRVAAPAAKPFSLSALLNVWRSRRALAKLDAHRLDDIGVTAKTAAQEARKPIWDVPATWRD